MISLTVEVTNLARLEYIQAFLEAPMRRAGARITQALHDHALQRFRTRGNGTWPALAPSTIAEKRRRGFPLDPLVRTGAMRNQYTTLAGPVRLFKERLTKTVPARYASFHRNRPVITDNDPVLTAKIVSTIEQLLQRA
jgi:hypothetical protein